LWEGKTFMGGGSLLNLIRAVRNLLT
jgi:hypothetical protein